MSVVAADPVLALHFAPPAPKRVEVVWEPCAACGGQRRVLWPVSGGYAWEECGACHGIGERLVAAAVRR